MNFCSNCGRPLKADAKFCTECGAPVKIGGDAQTTANATTSQAATNQQTAATSNARTPRHGLYDSATETLNKYTGESGAVRVNLKDLFSEVFKRHTKDEAETVFIAGTRTTTPQLADVSDEWAKPWLFSRILVGFLVAFFALLFMATNFQNANAIPGLILVGAFAVPVAGLVFFFESNAFNDISLFEVLKVFFIGGVFSLVVTVFLYTFVIFSVTSQVTGALTLQDSLSIGIVEELGKLIIVAYFIKRLNVQHILDGILIGAAVGAGFAAFETAGYIYNAGNLLLEVALLRGLTAIGGHLVWAAIGGGAVMLVKRAKPFKVRQLLSTQFLVFFVLAILMHAAWDWDVTILGSSALKMLALIVVAWIVVFVLMNAGLKEIDHLKTQTSN